MYYVSIVKHFFYFRVIMNNSQLLGILMAICFLMLTDVDGCSLVADMSYDLHPQMQPSSLTTTISVTSKGSINSCIAACMQNPTCHAVLYHASILFAILFCIILGCALCRLLHHLLMCIWRVSIYFHIKEFHSLNDYLM